MRCVKIRYNETFLLQEIFSFKINSQKKFDFNNWDFISYSKLQVFKWIFLTHHMSCDIHELVYKNKLPKA
jgi:hypothetical protein